MPQLTLGPKFFSAWIVDSWNGLGDSTQLCLCGQYHSFYEELENWTIKHSVLIFCGSNKDYVVLIFWTT